MQSMFFLWWGLGHSQCPHLHPRFYAIILHVSYGLLDLLDSTCKFTQQWYVCLLCIHRNVLLKRQPTNTFHSYKYSGHAKNNLSSLLTLRIRLVHVFITQKITGRVYWCSIYGWYRGICVYTRLLFIIQLKTLFTAHHTDAVSVVQSTSAVINYCIMCLRLVPPCCQHLSSLEHCNILLQRMEYWSKAIGA